MSVRDDVLKALEEARDKKIIGKSLEAKVTIVAKDEQTKEVLETIPYLHQMLIVSEAVVMDNEPSAKEYNHVNNKVEKHPGETCGRWWVTAERVREDKVHADIGSRCAEIDRKSVV